MTPPKLSADSAGRVHGANVAWNSPWPCPNGNPGGMTVPSGVMGVVAHTMVGNLPGTVSWFNNSAAQASAHFGVGQDGSIHQFGPVNGWEGWAEAGGNPNWYSIEFADNGNPANPLTAAQVNSAAQLVELLSRPAVGRFTLQVSDSPGTEGLGWHGMGGAAWGGHYDCPGDVRKAQRGQIIQVAQAIRAGGNPPVPPAPAPKPTTEADMPAGDDLIPGVRKCPSWLNGTVSQIVLACDWQGKLTAAPQVRLRIHHETGNTWYDTGLHPVDGDYKYVIEHPADVNGCSLEVQPYTPAAAGDVVTVGWHGNP